MFELQSRNNSKNFAPPLLIADHNIVVSNSDRTCTDTVCVILFLGFFGAFMGLLTYGLISGNVKSVFAIYNSDHIKCDSTNFACNFEIT